ncbi:hypothetical protein [Haloechinothrix sp. LS1_15]|uniref:hypothetical protein n=1 Tax=Haloechinothrix sp. LS1_15 TaxID=2652248 RepID=UPI00294770AE|nr:hypothetical protein [Haloechinothrix sp. LS1_15]MDV6011019.1 hypothetical protein [Haloechinothrix sp. LS1_15]
MGGRAVRAGAAVALLAAAALVFGCGGGTSNLTAEELVGDDTAVDGDPTTGIEPWGSHTWDDGLALEVGQPEECEPSDNALNADTERAVQFPMALENTTEHPFEFGMTPVVGEATFDGERVEVILDLEGPCHSDEMGFTVIETGETHEFAVSFAVGPEPGLMVFEVSPVLGAERVEMSGRV